MYTDEQRRRHIYDLQTFLRRIQRDQGYPNPSPQTGSSARKPLPRSAISSGRTACP